MPRLRLKWSKHALDDMARLHRFLAPQNPNAASRAIATIRAGVQLLAAHPEIGRPVEEMTPEFREWIIEFGQSAYVAMYHYDGREIVILRCPAWTRGRY